MRDDLLEAQASIDWAIAKLPAFAEEIAAWLHENIDCRVEKVDAPIPPGVVIAEQKTPLPRSFNVEAGICINAIRSSLDILATSLVIRHGIGNPKSAYFPVAKDASQFAAGSYKGAELVKRLPHRERSIIEALKPYNGGNDQLVALHNLDVMRKHQRLLNVNIVPGYKIADVGRHGGLRPLDYFYVGGQPAGVQLKDFIIVGGGPLNVNNKTVLAFIRDTSANYDIEFTPQITFNESLPSKSPEVIGALREFAGFASGIIKLFDI